MTRVLSGVALATMVLFTVWGLPSLATVVLASLVAALGAAEIAGLSSRLGAPVSARFVGPAAAVLCFVFGTQPTLGTGATTPLLPLVLLALTIAVALLTLAGGPPQPSVLARSAVALMAPIYVGVPLGALARLRVTHGAAVVTVLAAIVVLSDTAQYFVGRAAGRRRLAPLISPAKTLEGAVGGLIAATAVGAVAGARWVPELTPAGGAAVGALVAAAGIAGDLFESLPA
jgi:phosphatidate cytidylyltransferase